MSGHIKSVRIAVTRPNHILQAKQHYRLLLAKLLAHKAHQALAYPEGIKGPLLVVPAVKQLDGAAHDCHTEHQALQEQREMRSAVALQQEQCLLQTWQTHLAASQEAMWDHRRGSTCQQQHSSFSSAFAPGLHAAQKQPSLAKGLLTC